MTLEPPVVSATLFVKSGVPSEQPLPLIVPVFESIVVVPVPLQAHVGDDAKVHCVASTLTEGGRERPLDSQPFPALPSQSRVPAAHATHAPEEQVCTVLHAEVVHDVPQLWSVLMLFSHPLVESQSSVPAEHATHALPLQVWVCDVHATGVLHCPLDEQVSTPSAEHCVAFGVHTPVHVLFTHAELWHVTGVPHCPSEPQVATPLFEHSRAPGEQTPVHPVPVMHA
jgi:hypothetical protein